MKKNNLSVIFPSETKSTKEDTLELNSGRVVRRRSSIHSISATTAPLPATALFVVRKNREGDHDDKPLTKEDAVILRLAAAIRLIEDDLWQQYNESGGAAGRDDSSNSENPSYVAALANLDGDMPQYISDDTDDEMSHALAADKLLLVQKDQRFMQTVIRLARAVNDVRGALDN
jgi:hypothetical protein